MTTGVSPRALVPPPPVRCVPSVPARWSERKSPLLLFPFPLLIGTRRRDPPFGTLSPFRLRGRRGPDIFTGRTRYTHTLPRAAEEDLPRKRWCGQQESPPRFLLLRAAGHRPALEVTQSTFGARSDRTFDPSLFCYCSPEKSGRKREYGRTSPL